MKIFLIGLPGSGKTTLAKELAATLKLPYVDLDVEIEKAEMKTIPQIFKEKKEPYFRKIEAHLLKSLCQSDSSFVMATGGGAPCFFENMANMNQSGTTIFLDVPTMEIARRIVLLKGEERPLLKSNGIDGLKDQIEFLRSQRLSFYKQASITIRGDQIDSNKIIKEINL
ncbi:MAG: shikimate kinase [Cytophagales bacterium]|nr:shikimate kinase [Cytophagales bacterium]MCA6365591.1 shikimate kinase [Cytophagales bacterium]MCA6372534.1 shikimate kinase [Cytophagales bacterium]MCA6374310.1 shikimate kinase [Cytophagales bacterium]MCA6383187.1 shikimate kinase [Cytophagales bacterium]